MLHIFANALLIAVRMEPLNMPEEKPHPRLTDADQAKRRWLSIVGIRL